MSTENEILEHARRAEAFLCDAVVQARPIRDTTREEIKRRRAMVRLSLLNAYLTMGMVDDYISKIEMYEVMYAPIRAQIFALRKNKDTDGALIHPSALTEKIVKAKEDLHYFKFKMWRLLATEQEEAVIYDLPFNK